MKKIYLLFFILAFCLPVLSVSSNNVPTKMLVFHKDLTGHKTHKADILYKGMSAVYTFTIPKDSSHKNCNLVLKGYIGYPSGSIHRSNIHPESMYRMEVRFYSNNKKLGRVYFSPDGFSARKKNTDRFYAALTSDRWDKPNKAMIESLFQGNLKWINSSQGSTNTLGVNMNYVRRFTKIKIVLSLLSAPRKTKWHPYLALDDMWFILSYK